VEDVAGRKEPVMLYDQKGFSLVEFFVALALGFITLSIAMDVIVSGSKSLNEECIRIAANDECRLSFTKAVNALRDSATVIQNNDLDYDNVTDSTPRGVNFSLGDPDTGLNAVRGGLLVYTDSLHVTVFFDEDPAGEPGHFYPDVVGLDDLDGDGKSDILAFGIVPQDRNGDGLPDRVRRTSFTDARLPVVQAAGSSGYSPYYWKLVQVGFGNLGEVGNVQKWKDGVTLAYDLVPYITNYRTGNETYDVIQYEGGLPGNFDYGHDGIFGTHDAGEGDGVVDQTELGFADSTSFDGILNTASEIRCIISIRFKLRKVNRVDPIRFDISTVETGVTPRAFEMIFKNQLRFPIPVV
jgi:hypothetical protein